METFFFLPRSTPLIWTGDFLGGPGAYFLLVLHTSLCTLGRRPASAEGGLQADARLGILGGPGPSCPPAPVLQEAVKNLFCERSEVKASTFPPCLWLVFSF